MCKFAPKNRNLCYTMHRLKICMLLLASLFFLFPDKGCSETAKTEKPDIGNIILGHIGDEHGWHIATIGDKHLTIPLPIILWHEGTLHIFMSSKFQHGHARYQGFKIGTRADGEALDGKIICVNEKGEYTGQKPLDFSITKNVCYLFVTAALLIWLVFYMKRVSVQRRNQAPKGLQNAVEILITFVKEEIAEVSIEKAKSAKYLPFLLTVFFFILLSNLFGIIPVFPFGANLTGNIATTLVLAVITFLVTTFSGNKNYWKHIFNAPGTPWWLKFPIPLMPVIEIVSMLVKPFVLMVRLFANIMAGHIIILSFVCAIFIFGEMGIGIAYGAAPVPVLFAALLDILEILVAVIQAYVFTLLSAVYIGMATAEHHEENETKKI